MKYLYFITFIGLDLHQHAYSTFVIHAGMRPKEGGFVLGLTPLPQGISPFLKSQSKSLDVQGELRKLAQGAMDAALQSTSLRQEQSKPLLLEIEFPPLLGGSKSKTQFDDFDNIQELDANRDWSIEFAASFLNKRDSSLYKDGKTWILFADTKECEIAKKEWPGQKYRQATFTTIEAATEYTTNREYDSPWGASLSKALNRFIQSGQDSSSKSDILGDSTSLDILKGYPSLCVVIQPGNGGPVEDWINCEKIATSELFQDNGRLNMVIVNGALDKVRDGFYPSLFFPKLAATVDRFYKKFESILYLRPCSDKGVYGWIFRVFPEPWQVVLQSKEYRANGDLIIVDTVVYTSEKRPSYTEAVSALLLGSSNGI